MRALPFAASAAVAVLLLAGCTGPSATPPAPDCGTGDTPDLLALPVPGDFFESTIAAPWDTLVFAPDGFGDGWLVAGSDAQGGKASVTKLPGGHLANVSVPGIFATDTWVGWATSSDPGCPPPEAHHAIEWGLQRGPAFPPTAEPGKGVHVLTAGFLDNGTLFYTNIASIDASPLFPHPDWYAWEGDAPLPVYVYNASASEEPAYWKAPSRALPSGTPAEPAFGAARGVLAGPEAQAGLGYFATIRGFNDALKGLPLSTTRVVRMAPEDAYTREGNEAHPLYGQALTFVIKAVAVVDAPCPPAVLDVASCQSPLP